MGRLLSTPRGLGLLATSFVLLLIPFSYRHGFFWGGSYAELLHVLEFLGLILSMGGLAFCLFAAVRLVKRSEDPGALVPEIVRASTWIGLAAVLIFPLVSEDVFSYVLRGRVLGVHHANPYLVAPSAFQDVDPSAMMGKGWSDHVLPYGPLLALYQAGIALLTDGLGIGAKNSVYAGAFLMKLVNLLVFLLGARALSGLLADTTAKLRVTTLLLYLWSPFLMLEGVIAGHNDILLATPLLFALLSAKRQQYGRAVFLLLLAAQVKFVSLALGPVFLVCALREGHLKDFAIGTLLGSLLLTILGGLFWVQSGFGFLSTQLGFEGASLQSLLALVTGEASRDLTRQLSLASSVLFAMFLAIRCKSSAELPLASARTLVFLVFVGMNWSGPWYQIWWFPLLLAASASQALPAKVLTITDAPSYTVYLVTRTLGPWHQWVSWVLGLLLPTLAFMRKRNEKTVC